jgi:hypothetical protein
MQGYKHENYDTCVGLEMKDDPDSFSNPSHAVNVLIKRMSKKTTPPSECTSIGGREKRKASDKKRHA